MVKILNCMISIKNELEEIFDSIAEGVKIRTRCQWYEEGEKSTKFFLNLEKKRGSQGLFHKLFVNDRELTDLKTINNEIKVQINVKIKVQNKIRIMKDYYNLSSYLF